MQRNTSTSRPRMKLIVERAQPAEAPAANYVFLSPKYGGGLVDESERSTIFGSSWTESESAKAGFHLVHSMSKPGYFLGTLTCALIHLETQRTLLYRAFGPGCPQIHRLGSNATCPLHFVS